MLSSFACRQGLHCLLVCRACTVTLLISVPMQEATHAAPSAQKARPSRGSKAAKAVTAAQQDPVALPDATAEAAQPTAAAKKPGKPSKKQHTQKGVQQTAQEKAAGTSHAAEDMPPQAVAADATETAPDLAVDLDGVGSGTSAHTSKQGTKRAVGRGRRAFSQATDNAQGETADSGTTAADSTAAAPGTLKAGSGTGRSGKVTERTSAAVTAVHAPGAAAIQSTASPPDRVSSGSHAEASQQGAKTGPSKGKLGAVKVAAEVPLPASDADEDVPAKTGKVS